VFRADPYPRLGAPEMRRVDRHAIDIAAHTFGRALAWAIAARTFLDLAVMAAAQRAYIVENIENRRPVDIRPRQDMVADQPLCRTAARHRAAKAIAPMTSHLEPQPVLRNVISVARHFFGRVSAFRGAMK
jgi:hypothetical protein